MYKIKLIPENHTFIEIMGNDKKYQIPRFQRDYSWGDEQWQLLWDDIVTIRDNGRQRFIGYIVLEDKGDDKFTIIDGQQRITTLIILVLAMMARLRQLVEEGIEAEANRQRLDDINRKYIGILDHVTLGTEAKLTLNRNSKRYFKSLTTQLRPPVGNGKRANEAIRKCFMFFQKQLRETDGLQLAELRHCIGKGLLFTVVTTESNDDAYLLFEILNARGVHLTSADLIKNYLLSKLSEDDAILDSTFDELDELWGAVVDQLDDIRLTDFLHSHYSMSHRSPTKNRLYAEIRKEIRNSQKIDAYIRDINEYAPIYSLLQNPDDSHWGNDQYDPDIRKLLTVLETYSIQTPMNVLMAGYVRYSRDDFLRLLRGISNFSIRYNVIGQRPPNVQAKLYNDMACAVTAGEGAREVIAMLAPLYLNDEEFRSGFARKSMPSRRSPKKIMLLLRRIEEHLSGGKSLPAVLSIEHVLPFSYQEDWRDYFGGKNAPQAVERLGNFAILPPPDNMTHEPWRHKRRVLEESPYRINQRMAEYDEWTIDSVNAHQEWLAKQAAALWKIAEFDETR